MTKENIIWGTMGLLLGGLLVIKRAKKDCFLTHVESVFGDGEDTINNPGTNGITTNGNESLDGINLYNRAYPFSQ